MPPDNPVVRTDDVTNTRPVTDTKVADTSAVVTGNGKAKSGPSIKSLFVYDKTDTDIASFAKYLVKAYYPGAKMVGIDSIRSLASVLSKYSTIDTLIIDTHSGTHTLIIDSRIKSTEYISAELAKANVAVTSRIVFEGCAIMRDPVETCRMIAPIAGPSVRVVGYSYFVAVQVIHFDFSETQDESQVQEAYDKFDSRYWLPGLPSPKDAPGKKFSHGRRWFRKELDDTVPEGNSLRYIESYSSLGRVSAGSYEEAEKLRQKYAEPVFDGDLITVSNVSKVTKTK